MDTLADAIRIWNRSAISLIDIRHNLISPEETVHRYRMPASMFIYTSGGKAEVSLDDTSYSVERFGLFHGGKNTELTIQPNCGWLEYYMVLYKAGESSLHKRELAKLMERMNPFKQQYGFVPGNPIFFAEQLRKMYEQWRSPTPLHLFYGKTAFYQLVYEIYEELVKRDILVFQPDTVTMAKRYIEEHYNEAVSIQSIASVLGISASHLRRSFKSQYGESPQEFLMNTRLLTAKKLLLDRDISIRLVAAAAGFPDEFNFSKLFMKSFGMSPREYRAKTSNNMSDYTMDTSSGFSYNEERLVRLFEQSGEGVFSMLKNSKKKMVIVAALSLMLMLSACGTGTPANGDANAVPSQSITTQAPEGTTQPEEKTRTINTVKGNVEVPANPKRVVVEYFVGDVLALGIQPIGIIGINDDGVFKDQLANVTVIKEPESEAIMSLDPDLIIVGGDWGYEPAHKIAPTVVVPYDMPLKDRLTFIADVLNKDGQKSEELYSNYVNTVEKAKNKIDALNISSKTFTFVQLDEQIYLYGENQGPGSSRYLFANLGLNAPEAVTSAMKQQNATFLPLSNESLVQYCGDYLLVYSTSGEITLDTLKSHPVWSTAKAIQDGKVIIIPYNLLSSSDVQTSTALIEFISGSISAIAQ